MRDAVWRPCQGEAHGNAYQDDCQLCIPFWSRVPTCPDCGHRLWVKCDRTDGRCVGPKCPSSGERFNLNEGERDV